MPKKSKMDRVSEYFAELDRVMPQMNVWTSWRYDSGQPREDCPHGWDHTRTSQSSACRTTDILVAAARWFTA